MILTLLPFHFLGITGNEKAQGPFLHFHVVPRVNQGAARKKHESNASFDLEKRRPL